MRPLADITDVNGRALQGMLARDAYERHLVREVQQILHGAFVELTHDLTTIAPSSRDRARQMALWRQVADRLSRAYGQVDTLTRTELGQYAGVELEAARAEIAARLGGSAGMAEVSTVALMSSTIESIAHFPIEGLPLGEWWRAQAAAMSVATRRTLQIGMVQGESIPDLVARILPPRTGTAPAVWRQARAQATALVRTATNAVANDAAIKGFESAGPEITAWYELVAVRDARTTKICAALDGQRFRYDDPERKVPPFHIGCRTTTLPLLNHEALGIAAPAAPSFRSFDGWLGRQRPSVQDTVLGAKRAAMYRRGDLALPQLIDQDNRVLTLPQLTALLAA